MAKCKTITKDKIVVLKGEGNGKMMFNNPKGRELTKAIVDNCLIKTGKRCDYLLIDHNQLEHFVEMKGNKIAYACEQIEESIKQLSVDAKNGKKFAYVVSNSCPLTTTQIQVFKSRFKSNYNTVLEVKNKHYECSIE